MSRKKTKAAAVVPAAIDTTSPSTTPTVPVVSWAVAFCLLSVLLLALIWYPIAKLPAHYEMGPNEGYSSYYQQAAANGTPLYGQAPGFIYLTYGPLSFHWIGWLGRVT